MNSPVTSSFIFERDVEQENCIYVEHSCNRALRRHGSAVEIPVIGDGSLIASSIISDCNNDNNSYSDNNKKMTDSFSNLVKIINL